MSSQSIQENIERSKYLEEFGKNTKNLYKELMEDISNGKTDTLQEKITSLTAEELELLMKETQNYKSLGTASSEKQVIASVTNLRERYLKKLITTSMVSFLYQMEKEHTITQDDLEELPNEEDFLEEGPPQENQLNYDKFYNEELLSQFRAKFKEMDDVIKFKEMETHFNEDELLDISTKATETMNEINKPKSTVNKTKYFEAILKKCDEQSLYERQIISKFLDKLFHYDPLKHVQEGLQPNVHGDTERGTTVQYEHIPPNDTHCRFTSFYEINYEKLRKATLDIYCEKPDLEHAIIIYDVVNTSNDVETWMNKYGSNSKCDIVVFPLNCWTIQGAFKENRDRVDYYNKNNKIIKAILDQQEKDSSLGEELMRKRIKTNKVRSEKIFGKDSPEFDKYRKMNPNELETKYGITMEEVDDNNIKIVKEVITNAETGEEVKLDEDGVPLNGLEVPVTTINAQTGNTHQTRFFTEAQ